MAIEIIHKKAVPIAVLLSCLSLASYAEEEQKDSDDEDYTLKPVLLDGSNNQSTVLGLEYGLKNSWIIWEDSKPNNSNSTSDDDSWGDEDDVVDALSSIEGFVKAEVHGLWTSDAATNPQAFSKAALDIGLQKFLPSSINSEGEKSKDFDFSLQLALEGDQNYDNRQTVAAFQASGYFGKPEGTYAIAQISYGEVDASEDDDRMALTDDDKFDRLSVEVELRYGLNFDSARTYSPKSIGINLRYFAEDDAPQAIKDADLDVYERGSISLKFEKGFYIAYSNGKLPFDQEDQKVFELGFTQNLF